MNRYPEAYIEYLVCFHAGRDYFECHEVMEEFWKEHPGDPRGRTYVGLIQIAVGLYHQRRGNRAGAVKMLGSSLKNLVPEHAEELGLDHGKLIECVAQRVELLSTGGEVVYEDLNLPIKDDKLLAHCTKLCEERGLMWGEPGDSGKPGLIHKHTLRDRSEVIQERARQVEMKKKRRGETP